jgi:hypothetical protein
MGKDRLLLRSKSLPNGILPLVHSLIGASKPSLKAVPAAPPGLTDCLIIRVMKSMESLDTPEFHRLDGFMQGMSGLLSHDQLDWYFTVKGFAGTNLIAEDIILAAYPEVKAGSPTLVQCSTEEMVKEINLQLSVESPMWSDATWTAPASLLPNDTAMWRLMKECIDYEQGDIFRYEPKDSTDVFYFGVSGDFTFVIINEGQGRCLIISAADSD